MLSYRCYLLNESGGIANVVILQAPSDAEALVLANYNMQNRPYELWRGREVIYQPATVVKAQHSVRVTGPEVLVYLVSCGFRVKYSPRYSRHYYEGKLCSLAKLVELANTHRATRQLPPFAAMVNISVGRRRP
jgi:hypothetical protein